MYLISMIFLYYFFRNFLLVISLAVKKTFNFFFSSVQGIVEQFMVLDHSRHCLLTVLL